MINFIRKQIFKFNSNRTRPKDLFQQRKSDKTFWTYAIMEPCDVIAYAGMNIAMSHAFLNNVVQDEWGRWIKGKTLITQDTSTCEDFFLILAGGFYKVQFNENRILK